MKHTYFKLLWRSVWKTKTRFLSILAIVAIGVGFLGGLLATTPDMQLTADTYYDENHLFDIYIKGSAGLTEDDVTALRESGRFDRVMPAHVEDVELTNGDETFVARVYAVPLGARGGEQFVNDFVLKAGALPAQANECLIASPNGYAGSHTPGEVYSLAEDAVSSVFEIGELTATGIVASPQYMSVESEPSTVGRGQVELIVYVFPEVAALEVYTDIYLTVAGAQALDTFSSAYAALIEENTTFLESFGETRAGIRYDEIYREGADALADARAEYEQAKLDAETQLADAEAELEQARTELADAERTYNENLAQVESGEASIAAAEQQLADALAAAEASGDTSYIAQVNAYAEQTRAELEVQRQTLAEARNQLSDAAGAIAEGRRELEDGEAELAEARQEADTELAGALAEIEDAQAELDALETPEWYLFDRQDTVSFTSYKSNSEKVDAIAKVFPVFFFLVAALVALTTMTRMVEEERTQIGTLKALGYTRGAIALYYIGYSVLASLIGSILGILIGYRLLPAVIANAYTMLYTMPETVTKFYWSYTLIIVPIAVLCTTAATLFACLSQLDERPSTLMLPRTPKVGKRVLLERIPLIWKRLSFTRKVTVRNIFRYKKRFYMTVIGVAGCCALLVAGFGLRDSIRDIVDLQFGQIYKYNLSVYLSEAGAEESDPVIASFLEESPYISNSAVLSSSTGSVAHKGKSGSVNIYVPQVTEELTEQFTLRNRKTGQALPFDDDAFLLTEKLCETLGVKAGDSVTLKNADGKTASLTVTGICENYLSAGAFLSAKSYEAAFGTQPDYRLLLIDLNDESQQARDEVSEALLHSEHILMLQFAQSIRDSFENTVKNIDYIVIVLIIAAALLAVIVVYNLTNINICERQRELATIKVLGFHEGEVARYIYRETTVLCLIGILAGFALGAWLHAFVVHTAEVDAVMFGRTVHLQSYLLAALVTIVFTALVDLVMLRKLRAINMVESLKANE